MPSDGSSAKEDGCRRPNSRRDTDDTLLSDAYGPRAVNSDPDRHIVTPPIHLSTRVLVAVKGFHVIL